MSDTLKVKGHAHLIRDLKSQAIINTDSDAYAKYMARKIKQKEKDDEVRQVVRDVNELRNEMREIKTICHCGKKATMVARLNEEGKVITKGQQIQIGGNESYISLCRLHWCEEIENANINDYQS